MNKLRCALLIDDDSINNFINQKLLQKMNLCEKVKTVPNGEEGIRYIKESGTSDQPAPDLILLDINMPVMDGFEFLKAYRTLALSHKKPVIKVLLTTETTPKDTERLNSLGISGFINKPVTEQQILEVMKQDFGWQ